MLLYSFRLYCRRKRDHFDIKYEEGHKINRRRLNTSYQTTAKRNDLEFAMDKMRQLRMNSRKRQIRSLSNIYNTLSDMSGMSTAVEKNNVM